MTGGKNLFASDYIWLPLVMTINKAEGPNDICGKHEKGPGKYFQLRIHHRKKISAGSHTDKRHSDLNQSSQWYKLK